MSIHVFLIPSVLCSEDLRQNVSATLDNLLQFYDSNLRPGYGGSPTIIKTDIYIRSMGPISEVEMTYSMDCYFRQTWLDERLAFNSPNLSTLAVHYSLLEKIWTPDTVIYNGLKSHAHTITTPNKFLRICQDGTIYYSMRLTIKTSCPMALQYFPLDYQICPLVIGSDAYTDRETVYEWKQANASSITIDPGVKLSQFNLIGHPHTNYTLQWPSKGSLKVLEVKFQFRRNMGYFLLQVYVPCSLVVVLSFVSFWINREATADRVGLGITTVLTLTTMFMENKMDLPKTSTSTALDWFFIMCFTYIIATMLEFAAVHYFTKIGSGEVDVTWAEDEEEEEEKSFKQQNERVKVEYLSGVKNRFSKREPRESGSPGCFSSKKARHRKHRFTQPHRTLIQHRIHNVMQKSEEHGCLLCLRCLRGDSKYRKLLTMRGSPDGINSVSRIDKVSRIVFPLTFTILNVLYWHTCSSQKFEMPI
ncbi:gamma-aminobutyric acid receptor alpha-like [Lingula anatina]|uniref:Gamma-aminobutyric acid receptor alpha-like n=1 Tax=Lingula anatina TaxID=7574 RepID=A0A1S3JNP3_LINAN|nr:gamma-aminobutyric acid receptor alpha-like [Lingula anatina]|eukprot:XP_013411589.1 gamma-aminobutyric acid receptor alpha-like [Lingula anatina]